MDSSSEVAAAAFAGRPGLPPDFVAGFAGAVFEGAVFEGVGFEEALADGFAGGFAGVLVGV